MSYATTAKTILKTDKSFFFCLSWVGGILRIATILLAGEQVVFVILDHGHGIHKFYSEFALFLNGKKEHFTRWKQYFTHS